jgi:hypothetical protein
MPVGAISQASAADLASALGQSAGQAQGLQSIPAMAALKDTLSSEAQSILELVNAAVQPGAPGSQLNVYA